MGGVADEYDFRVRFIGVVEEAGEEPGACHGGFVDDEHGPGGEASGLVELAEEAGDRVGRDAGRRLQFGGGACGERATDDRVATVVPGGAGGVEGERLASAGGGDHDVDTPTGGGQRDHQLNLLGRQFASRAKRIEQGSIVRDTDIRVLAG